MVNVVTVKRKKMRKDLILHAILSFLISLSVAFLIQQFWLTELMFISTPATMIVGLAKEFIWDKLLGKGTFEGADLWFDLWGALAGTILAYMIW
jgi:hypothetical protein